MGKFWLSIYLNCESQYASVFEARKPSNSGVVIQEEHEISEHEIPQEKISQLKSMVDYIVNLK